MATNDNDDKGNSEKFPFRFTPYVSQHDPKHFEYSFLKELKKAWENTHDWKIVDMAAQNYLIKSGLAKPPLEENISQLAHDHALFATLQWCTSQQEPCPCDTLCATKYPVEDVRFWCEMRQYNVDNPKKREIERIYIFRRFFEISKVPVDWCRDNRAKCPIGMGELSQWYTYWAAKQKK